MGDNYSKIEAAMAKIEREGNHPDETGQFFQVARACAGRDTAPFNCVLGHVVCDGTRKEGEFNS